MRVERGLSTIVKLAFRVVSMEGRNNHEASLVYFRGIGVRRIRTQPLAVTNKGIHRIQNQVIHLTISSRIITSTGVFAIGWRHQRGSPLAYFRFLNPNSLGGFVCGSQHLFALPQSMPHMVQWVGTPVLFGGS